MASHVGTIAITKITGSSSERKHDLVAVEEPLEIRLGYGPSVQRVQRNLAVTMRTPGHDFELAIGFLFTEGIIQSYEQVESIKYCTDTGREEEKENVVRIELKPDVQFAFEKLQRNFYTTSSCGVCGKSSIEAVKVQCNPVITDWQVNADLLHTLPARLRDEQRVFEHTGGLHASGLFDLDGNLVLLREDVGRHNALDKVIGAMLAKHELPATNYILLVSGRTSFELVQKAALAGIPMLAAVGAPSSLAVSLAHACGMTLIGFLRDGRCNIYAHPERVIITNL
jgi:FdhD protein